MRWHPAITEVRLGALVALLTTAAYLVLIETAPLRILEGQALDLRFQLRGPLEPVGDIAIVQIDDRSIAEIGRWPWPRTRFAEAVDRLKEAGARIIAFDLLFTEAQDTVEVDSLRKVRKALKALDSADAAAHEGAIATLREQVGTVAANLDADATLAGALTSAGNVILPFSFVFRSDLDPSRRSARAPSRSVTSWAYATTATPDAPGSFALRPDDLLAPIGRLAKRTASGGHVNVGREADGRTRYEYPVLPYQGRFYPSLSVQVAGAYLGLEADDIEVILGEGIRLSSRWIPTDDAMRSVVNLYDTNGTIPIHSFNDVVGGEVDPTAFCDTIVLIGANALAIKDEFVTPFSPNFTGTERLAIVIDNVLSERFVDRRDVFWLIDVVVAMASGLILGVAAAHLSAYAFSFFALGLGGTLVVGNQVAFGVYDIWLNFTLPAATMLASYSALTIYRYFVQERSTREIRAAFSHYIHPDLVKTLAANPERLVLGGEMRRMSFLFADVRGFTGIAEQFKNDPQGLTSLINRFLTPMTNTIMERHGTIDKYIGDCIMAFWNAPLDDPEHAANVSAAALAMLSRLVALNEETRREAAEGGRAHHPIRIGVNTGECCVGNMGSEQRFDYSVLGDAVNLAARLEALSKTYGVDVVIGEDTRAAVPDLAAFELDRLAVRGKTESLAVFCFLGDAERAADPAFQAFVSVHNAMLAAYRSRDWQTAVARLRECRSADLGLDLTPLYDLYDSRIAAFREAPPPEDWDGVFVALAQ